jgi:hypothetical protein
MSTVRYELGFYIPEDITLHSRTRENLKSQDVRRSSETVMTIITTISNPT